MLKTIDFFEKKGLRSIKEDDRKKVWYRKYLDFIKENQIFAFGLSERERGADVYATEMTLTPKGNGKYLAVGEKYHIGNANEAAMVSTFGKVAGIDAYCGLVAMKLVASRTSDYQRTAWRQDRRYLLYNPMS